ncbi:MAG: UDP-N-acetylmuramate--L-alanine ligase [bacterium]|nr:UDP-N-acetylmuramate--L-alanine ligase [bacterium]
MKTFPYTQVHLVGIKGVAMTALAQLLRDHGVQITGSDVPDDFVTQEALSNLAIDIQTSFSEPLPIGTACVIYTAAHQSKNNEQVQAALAAGIPTLSHAEALGLFFDEKRGVAVCGVGGKSTTSAMIVWILEHLHTQPSYAIGVGKILGLPNTGKFSSAGEVFVAEADEYVTDPTQSDPKLRIPRFSYLHPRITVCTNILHDHPDVYKNKSDTDAAFNTFFSQMKHPSTLIVNSESSSAVTVKVDRLITYGTKPEDTFRLQQELTVTEKQAMTKLQYDGQMYQLTLAIPGFFNMLNAAAAIAACVSLGQSIEDCLNAIKSFASTQRRFENKGVVQGVQYYDDYAHHPAEIAATITAAKEWEPNKRIVFAFQPHTYSRTKELFSEFVTALALADEVLLLPIYASAREQANSTISSEMLISAVSMQKTMITIELIADTSALAAWCALNLQPGDVCITLGAGDIYLVHELLQ